MTKPVKKTSVKTIRKQSSLDNKNGFPTPDQIAARAYNIWEQGGCQNGTADHDWARAEQEARDSNP